MRLKELLVRSRQVLAQHNLSLLMVMLVAISSIILGLLVPDYSLFSLVILLVIIYSVSLVCKVLGEKGCSLLIPQTYSRKQVVGLTVQSCKHRCLA